VAFIFILCDQFWSVALHGLLDRFRWLKVFLLVVLIRTRFSADDNYIVQNTNDSNLRACFSGLSFAD